MRLNSVLSELGIVTPKCLSSSRKSKTSLARLLKVNEIKSIQKSIFESRHVRRYDTFLGEQIFMGNVHRVSLFWG